MLTRYLVEHHGFRLVAIEASVSRLAVLDRYTHGAGGPDSIARILETGWIGRRPLRELVAWLREWNQRHPEDPVRLLGLDPQENEFARGELRDFIARAYRQAVERYAAVERELAAADSQASVFGDSSVDPTARSFLREVVALGETDAPGMRRLMDAALVRAGLEAARLLLQFAEFNAGEADSWSRSRDWYMAVNLLGALESTPQPKAVVWAHNAHVAGPIDRPPASQPMGSWLRASLGCRYGAVALTFGRGAFVAQIPDDLEDDLAISTLPEAPIESIEGVLGTLHEAGTLATWPCETGAAGPPEWLQGPQSMHWVGALFQPGTDPSEALRPFRLVEDFDGIAFLSVVTADEIPRDRPLVPARSP
jgi:erythromycin esterase